MKFYLALCLFILSSRASANCGFPIDFTFSQSACNSRQITLTNSSPNTLTATWFFGDGQSAIGNQVTHTYNQLGIYSIRLQIVYTNGCIDEIIKLIPVVAEVDPTLIQEANQSICIGDTVQLTGTSGINFCWSPISGLSNPNISNPKAFPTTTTTYYYTSQVPGSNLVVNGNFSSGNTGFTSAYTPGFPNTIEAQYWIGNNPNAWNVNFNSCVEHTTGSGNMMMVNGSSNIGAIVWEQSISVLPNTNYAFSTWVQSLAALNPARLRFSINNLVLGDNINAGNVACVWSNFYTVWNSGNQTTATIRIVNNNTIADGNDFAIDDISFSKLDNKYDSVIITVLPRPTLTVSNDTSVCLGQSVPLTVSGASTYSWLPATGLSNPSIANPVASPLSTTNYIVTGQAANGCSSRDSVRVAVLPLPQISTSNDTTICENSSVQVQTTGGNTYSWSPTAGVSNPGLPNPVISPPGSGYYYVTGTNAQGCSNRDSLYFTLVPRPQLVVSNDTSVCENRPVPLQVSGASSVTWSPNTGLSSATSFNPIATTANTITYYVSGSSLPGCNSIDSVLVTIFPNPPVQTLPDTTICEGAAITLTTNGASTYSWTPGTALSSTSIASPVASPTDTIRYMVTGTDNNGCVNRDSVWVFVKPGPVFSISPATQSVCAGNSISITAQGAASYQWFTSSQQNISGASQLQLTAAVSDTFYVELRDPVCRVTDTLSSILMVDPLPVTRITKSNDVDCNTLQSTLNASGGVGYIWTPNQYISNNSVSNPVVSPLQDTWYKVEVTTNKGCKKTDSILVRADMTKGEGKFFVPSAFTPNKDGKNDCFGVKYWGVASNFILQIYNRYGQLVYQTRNFQDCWDGTFKGMPQPSGVFIYQITTDSPCSTGRIYRKGTVLLMR